MKNIPLSVSYDLVEYVADIIPKNSGAKNLVVFPGKRPGYFLQKRLSKQNLCLEQTDIYSIDEFVDYLFKKILKHYNNITPLDAVSILLIHKSTILPSINNDLRSFIQWGLKIFSDFEQMYIEHIKPERIAQIQEILEENYYESVRKKFDNIAVCYREFYEYIKNNQLSTRAFRYKTVSEQIQNAHLESFKSIIFAGFFALTYSEKQIFNKIETHPGSVFVFQESEGIKKMLKDIKFQTIPEKSNEKPIYHFYRASDVHSQVIELKQRLHKTVDSSSLICIPSAGTLFPVIQYILPDIKQYNISIGYPLSRTPLFALLNILKTMIQGISEEQIFVPHYLSIMLHPYIKNIRLKNSNMANRILFHTIEDYLIENKNRFVKLQTIENNIGLIEESLKKIKNAGLQDIECEDIKTHILKLHSVIIKAFLDVKDIKDFFVKIGELILFIAEQSSVKDYQYTARFIETAVEKLNEIKNSLLLNQRLPNTEDYFLLLENYIRTIDVPFPGTPVEGLQVLGFLETRNLKFKNVYILDANEGIIPDTKKEDTILSYSARKYLGLPTHEEREAISKHYFDTLVNSANNVHIFYVENKDKEKSRFVEQKMWQLQKTTSRIHIPNHKNISLSVNFYQKDTVPIEKKKEYLNLISGFTFSPTSLDVYLSCGLKFFYQYILGLSEKQKIKEDIEKKHIGSVVHKILKSFLIKRKTNLLNIKKDDYKEIEFITDKMFEEEYGPAEGRLYLIRLQVKKRMRDYLEYIKLQTIIVQECEREYFLNIKTANGTNIGLKGTIDRIDLRDNQTFIIDYKTGSEANLPTIKFSPRMREKWDKTLKSVQLPFYIFLFLENNKRCTLEHINSALVMLGKTKIEEKPLFDKEADREELFKNYKEAILQLIEEILNPKIEFAPTKSSDKHCRYCLFNVICGKQYVGKWINR